MPVTCEVYEHVTVFNLAGELASEQAELFKKVVLDALERDARFVVLNMQAVPFVDSGGLEALLWAQEQCEQRLGHLRLCGLDENLKKIMYVTRLEGQFEAFDAVTDAVKLMR